MNKFKKIAAVAIAAVTLATATITAGASSRNIRIDSVTPTHLYNRAPYVHYSKLSDYFDNIVTYSRVSSSLGRDNVVLSVDFTEPGANKVITDEIFEEIPNYMEELYLKDANGKYITEGKYPLEVDQWSVGDEGRVNVIVGNNNIFKKLDFSNVRYYLGSRYDGRKDRDIILLNYKIQGSAVLPSYKVTIGSTVCDTVFDYNYIDNFNTGKLVTSGKMRIFIPHSLVGNGTTLPISINGVKVADITLSPTRSCPSYTNY